jgi:hypothetical protein
MARLSGWQELPSGEIVHLQAGKPPTRATLEALDDLVAAVHRQWESPCTSGNPLAVYEARRLCRTLRRVAERKAGGP